MNILRTSCVNNGRSDYFLIFSYISSFFSICVNIAEKVFFFFFFSVFKINIDIR